MSNKNLSLYFNPSAPATFSSALNDDWDDMDIPVRSVALSTKDDPKLLETENTFFQQLATLARARLEKDTDPSSLWLFPTKMLSGKLSSHSCPQSSHRGGLADAVNRHWGGSLSSSKFRTMAHYELSSGQILKTSSPSIS